MDNVSVFKLKSVSRYTYDNEIQTYFSNHPTVPSVSWLWVADDTVYGYNLQPIHFTVLNSSEILGTLVECPVSEFPVPACVPQYKNCWDEEQEAVVQIKNYEIVNYWEEQV